MKKFLIAFLVFTAVLTGGSADEAAFSVITNNFGARNYAPGAIPKADLDKIVSAGARAPSAGNRQPWRFIVVSTSALVKKVFRDAPDGNAVVIVLARQTGRDAAFDCALATENIYLAAQALGYGSRIYVGPLNDINGGLRNELGISREFNAVAAVRVGRLPLGVDAASSASSREPESGLITYK
ncbi:MAG: nitroreductase family protein [Spirochaetaceae bacterium]|jgi:nitroreductase|nr:nitroreductase family protein [Spirochaetaceae bacterium]